MLWRLQVIQNGNLIDFLSVPWKYESIIFLEIANIMYQIKYLSFMHLSYIYRWILVIDQTIKGQIYPIEKNPKKPTPHPAKTKRNKQTKKKTYEKGSLNTAKFTYCFYLIWDEAHVIFRDLLSSVCPYVSKLSFSRNAWLISIKLCIKYPCAIGIQVCTHYVLFQGLKIVK